MGLTVRLTPRASADLEDIRAYLVPRHLQGAENVRRRIEKTIDLLAEYPGLARPTDIAGLVVSPVVAYPYLIYAHVTSTELVVVHIRHGAREAPEPQNLTIK